jgi:hypothetical protein
MDYTSNLRKDDMRVRDIPGLYDKAVNALSFSSELYKLRRELNARIDQPETIAPAPKTRALGVSRWFKRRRISIAEAYLMVVGDLDSGKSKARLRALRMMLEVSFHAKTLDMPFNTARVQMALIKEAVKHRNDRRRQLELLHDFSMSSYGQFQVIRRLCDELNIVELPETGLSLRELGAGRDLHVHDTATTGRKNATQLLIDAFIKGLSEITIAYSSFAASELMEEAVEAGRMLGIKVNIGIEFSLLREGSRFHFMALLPEFREATALREYLRKNRRELGNLASGLEENQTKRIESVKHLLAYFNENYIDEINAGFPEGELYRLGKLRMRDLKSFVPLSGLNRTHLGEFLYARLKSLLANRVLYLKAIRAKALHDMRHKLISDWDFGVIDGRYKREREEYRDLSPDQLGRRYFSNPLFADYQSVFDDLAEMKRALAKALCALRVLHPLEHGLDRALALLEGARGLLDQVEVYNMQDSVHRDPEETVALCRRLNELNALSAKDGTRPFVPVCGSDATGRSPEIPGMGFVFADALKGKYRARYLKRHVSLPAAVARLVRAEGAVVDLDSAEPFPALVSMGKISGRIGNRLGDETDASSTRIPPGRALRYLNPGLKNAFNAGVGFIVANWFVGPAYALLWLGITGFRNTIADLIATRGARFSQWTVKNVSFDNVARSLFWTGFSVPILDFVKTRFDLLWPFAAAGFVYNAAKFFFISFSNGLYLAAHNKLRGFDRSVIRANLFRSILSWPIATLLAPLGNALGIPSIVQAKICSDLVAGFIEGGNKYFKVLRLRRRDLEEILPRISAGKKENRLTAILDLLYLFREEPRAKSSLKVMLEPRRGLGLPLAGARDPAAAEQAGSGTEATAPAEPPSAARILATLSAEGIDRDLIDFILSRHSQETAVDLIDLVAATLPEFRDWLASWAPQPGTGVKAPAGADGDRAKAPVAPPVNARF